MPPEIRLGHVPDIRRLGFYWLFTKWINNDVGHARLLIHEDNFTGDDRWQLLYTGWQLVNDSVTWDYAEKYLVGKWHSNNFVDFKHLNLGRMQIE